MRVLLFLCILAGFPASAETLVAARTIRSQTILSPADVTLIAGTVPGAYTHPEQIAGLEARVILYAGRPVKTGDVGPAAIIERNQIITLRFQSGGLHIATDARALGRAGIGDTLRVMNLTSRNTVSGTVTQTGEVVVGPVPSR